MTTTPLPQRPRLNRRAVLLDRGAEEVQLGLDGVVLPAEVAVALLPRLDGRTRLPELRAVARGAGLDGPGFTLLMASLLEAGLLEGPPVPWSTVRVCGLGTTAALLVQLLVELDVAVEVDAGWPPGVLPARVVADPRRTAEAARPALVVVVAEAAEAERGLLETLRRREVEHLVVAGGPAGVTVGPLVQPRHSPCLRCVDLARRDLDPAWPWLLAQLTRTPAERSGLQRHWAAATAAAEVAALLAGERPVTVGATLELGSDHRVRRRRWASHADCDCAWPRTTQWAA